MNISKNATLKSVVEDLQAQRKMIFKNLGVPKKIIKQSLTEFCFSGYVKNKDREKERKKRLKKINSAIERAIFKGKHNNIIKTDNEKRLVIGPVLIPENIDLQDDIISSEEIEQAAHNYMVKLAFQNDLDFLLELGLTTKSERGFMHVEFSRKLAVVESYVSPIDFELNGRMITKGTWIMTMKVFDDESWALIKSGKITGFSIGGRAKSTEETIQE